MATLCHGNWCTPLNSRPGSLNGVTFFILFYSAKFSNLKGSQLSPCERVGFEFDHDCNRHHHTRAWSSVQLIIIKDSNLTKRRPDISFRFIPVFSFDYGEETDAWICWYYPWLLCFVRPQSHSNKRITVFILSSTVTLVSYSLKDRFVCSIKSPYANVL